MYFQQRLGERLRERRDRLHANPFRRTYQHDLASLVEFIDGTPYLRTLVLDLELQPSEFSESAWVARLRRGERLDQLGGEATTTRMCLAVMRRCIEHEDPRPFGWLIRPQKWVDINPRAPLKGMGQNADRDDQAGLRGFTEGFVDRVVNYLLDRIEAGSNVLYLLEKYKRRVEWFRRPDLLARISEDTRRSEAMVDADLREFLFEQGIEYPFSTPQSPSGRADIIADFGDGEPIPLEVKLFDPSRGYGRDYVRQGFRQAHDYAADYLQSAGYLVVFNCTLQPLEVRSSVPKREWPPRITVGHRTVFVVVVDLAADNATASKRPPLKPYVVDEEFLVLGTVDEAAGVDAHV